VVGVGSVTVIWRRGWLGLVWPLLGVSELVVDGLGGRRCIRVSISGGQFRVSTTVKTAKLPWGLLTMSQVSLSAVLSAVEV
jgi:hypothetical protein